MQTGNISRGKPDGKSTMGNYDHYPTFGKAFHAAHALGGPDKLYSTNCKDGGNYQIKNNQFKTAYNDKKQIKVQCDFANNNFEITDAEKQMILENRRKVNNPSKYQ